MENTLQLGNLLKEGTYPEEYTGGKNWTILHGDTLKLVKAFQPGIFDAVITDPPYASGGTKQNERNRTTNQKYSSMNCYVMGNRLNVHQMKCIRKIPVGEGGTDKHTNIAFISEEIWRAVMTEDISETIRIMKKFNMDDKQRRRFNRLRENYGLLPIKKR